MNKESVQYSLVAPSGACIENLSARGILRPFDPAALDFIAAFSGEILADSTFKRFPELISMAYWMRKTHIARLRREFFSGSGNHIRLGRGLVFHIAPSNVDSIFIYSWFLSLMAGNTNIVRISEKGSEQTSALTDCINSLCRSQLFKEVADRFMIIRYGHDIGTTSFFSSLCDLRVVWGGDSTISAIRQTPVGPQAAEIVFPDRVSMCLIRASAFLEEKRKGRVVDGFYNDAYWFHQMACSSPRIVVWIGSVNDISMCRELFWKMLEEKVTRERFSVSARSIVDKLVAEYSIAVRRKDVHIEDTHSNLVSRVLFSETGDMTNESHCGGGLFFELTLGGLEDLKPLLVRRIQTAAVFGFSHDELSEFLMNSRPRGIDRVVPIGRALDFSVHWDGYDLLRQFCREVAMEL